MILVDTNVWIDLIQRDPVWVEWSKAQIMQAKAAGDIAINAVIYAEMVSAYDSEDELAHFVRLSKAKLAPLSSNCAYLAGRAFEVYRERGGNKTGVMADFFIGAQALCEGWPLLTRDPGRYKTYFPKVKLICP